MVVSWDVGRRVLLYDRQLFGGLLAVGFGDEEEAMVFVSVPSPDTLISIESPSFRKFGGFNPSPTPAGVPVASTSPGCSVCASLIVLMRYGIEKIKSSVVASCLNSPLTRVCTLSVFGSSDAGTAIGPMGQNVSGLLPI